MTKNFNFFGKKQSVYFPTVNTVTYPNFTKIKKVLPALVEVMNMMSNSSPKVLKQTVQVFSL